MHLLKFYNGESIQQKYLIGEKIGTGKFSVVYRCQGIADNKEFAIKEIASHKLDNESKNLIAY
jgi:serine/threonine protein kinase